MAGTAVLLGAFTALTMSGCSTVPDSINPVEWYHGTKRWITGADAPVESTADAGSAKPADSKAGADEGASPDLNKTPDRAPKVMPEANREAIIKGLIADRMHARYSDAQIPEPPAAVPLGGRALPKAQPSAPTVVKGEELPPASPPPAAPAQAPAQARAPQFAAVPPPSAAPEKRTFHPPLASKSAASKPAASGSDSDFDTVVISGDSVQKTRSFAATSAPAPAPSFAPAAAPAFGVGQQRLIAVIPFGPTSVTLAPEDRQLLADVVAALREYGGSVRVVGYASDAASRKLGGRLPSDRADKVAREMINLGVPPESITTQTAGEGGVPPQGSGVNRAEVYFDN